ncbi:DUF2333 family protein [Salinibius halmophilus]|uniref:DUF2333 family protein n=1 Tax=Salinibius halmophilus TaxID=1853216 RepID=UPI001F1806CD|nr:DUF2333 family protein [Salinibius halmophilus]
MSVKDELLGHWHRLKAKLTPTKSEHSSEGEPALKKMPWRYLGFGLAGIFALLVLLGIYWSNEPKLFDVPPATANPEIIGSTSVATVDELVNVMLNKPGGMLANDVTPPSIWLDNIPSWEVGVIFQVRDFSRALRRDFSRSQSQSQENGNLVLADPQFNVDIRSWLIPAAESEYREGQRHWRRYQAELESGQGAQFYARADSLNRWLGDVQTRIGSLSQELSASVGRPVVGSENNGEVQKTPWLQIDNVFYEARGQSYALIHLLKAIEVDFADVLEKKEAQAPLAQIIRELEATQKTVWSPVILNGSGFGMVANHSLVMANYLSRASAAIGDLRELLSSG